MSSQIRVGILGCASIAKRSLAPAFASHTAFKVAAIASRTPEKAGEFAAQYGADPCSYDELVARNDVDLVYCPLPTGLHYEWVKKCLLNKKHVLCEKSLAINYDQVKDLVETARNNRCFLMESFQFRFHPQNLYVKKLLSENAIGEIRGLDVKFGFPPFPDGAKNIRYSKSLGGGALLDAGAYTIKATTYLLGNDCSLLIAIAHHDSFHEVDLSGDLMMESGRGVVSKTSYGFSNYYQCGYEIWGAHGKITTTRAFTAKPDFSAEVRVETADGTKVEKFQADHFALMLDHVSQKIYDREFSGEYEECLTQSKILSEARKMTEEF